MVREGCVGVHTGLQRRADKLCVSRYDARKSRVTLTSSTERPWTELKLFDLRVGYGEDTIEEISSFLGRQLRR
jgi:hypothetical protein